jgi:hypothetical protein
MTTTQAQRAMLRALRLTAARRARPTTAVSALEARILRATDPVQTRTADRIGRFARVEIAVALPCLRRLRKRYLVDDDGSHPRRWLRTQQGDVALEFAE